MLSFTKVRLCRVGLTKETKVYCVIPKQNNFFQYYQFSNSSYVLVYLLVHWNTFSTPGFQLKTDKCVLEMRSATICNTTSYSVITSFNEGGSYSSFSIFIKNNAALRMFTFATNGTTYSSFYDMTVTLLNSKSIKTFTSTPDQPTQLVTGTLVSVRISSK